MKIKHIIYIVLLMLSILTIVDIYHNCKEAALNEQYEHNISALQDTISYYTAQNEQLVATKTIFQTKIDDLEQLNNDLYDKIESLEIKNKVIGGVNVNGNIENIQRDTVYKIKTDTIIPNFKYNFNFNDKWRTLEGDIIYKNSSLALKIERDITIFNYTVAVDDRGKVYVHSENPHVKYNEISGFVIPQKRKTHFTVGPMIGAGYGVFHNKFDLYVGLSLTWKIFEF